MKQSYVRFLPFIFEIFVAVQVGMSDHRTLSREETKALHPFAPDIIINSSEDSLLKSSYLFDSNASVTWGPTIIGLSTIESNRSSKSRKKWTRSTFENSTSDNLTNDTTILTYHTTIMNPPFKSFPTSSQPQQYPESPLPQGKRDQLSLAALGNNPKSTSILLDTKNKSISVSRVQFIPLPPGNYVTSLNLPKFMLPTASPLRDTQGTTPMFAEYNNQSVSNRSYNKSSPKATMTPSIPLYIQIYSNQTTKRKCCPIGMILDRDSLSCQNKTLFNITEWKDFFEVVNLRLQIIDPSILNDFTWRSNTDPSAMCFFDKADEHLTKGPKGKTQGRLQLINSMNDYLIDMSCIEYIHDKGRIFVDIFTCVTLNVKRKYHWLKCADDFCRQKCCRIDQILNSVNMICENASSYNLEPLYHHELGTTSVSNPAHFAYYVQRSQVLDSNPCVFFRKDNFVSLQDNSFIFGGKKYPIVTNGTKVVYLDFSCTDVLINGNDFTSDIMACYTLGKVFLPKVVNHLSSHLDSLVRIMKFVSTGSIVCLVLLIVLSPTKLTLHTNITISLCVAVILQDIFLASSRFINLSPKGCVAKGLLLEYIRQTISFWVSVMCYDIARVIRRSGIVRPFTQLTKSKLLYPSYCAFAWGLPCLNSIILVLLDHLPARFLPDPNTSLDLRPKFDCFGIKLFSTPKWIFLDIPGIFLFFVNVILLAHSGILLHCRNKSCLCFRSGHQQPSVRIRSNQTKDYAKMYLERILIYLVLLTTRILYLVISLHNSDISLLLLYLLVVFASMRGIMMFMIISATRNWSLIREVLGRMRRLRKRGSPHSHDNPVEQTRF